MYAAKIIILITVFVTLFWNIAKSLQVIPERAMKTYVNDKYAYPNASINVRRYSRRSAYYINIEATLKKQFANNVSAHLVFYEFLHNEYKRSFVEMKFPKLCDFIQNDPYVGRAIRNVGVKCPLDPGPLKVMNISVPADDFPNVWPFEKSKVEVTLTQNKNGEKIATFDVYLLFKQKSK